MPLLTVIKREYPGLKEITMELKSGEQAGFRAARRQVSGGSELQVQITNVYDGAIAASAGLRQGHVVKVANGIETCEGIWSVMGLALSHGGRLKLYVE